jgi:hypothetical protein
MEELVAGSVEVARADWSLGRLTGNDDAGPAAVAANVSRRQKPPSYTTENSEIRA